MSHPGSFPGDPAEGQPDPATGAFEYPTTGPNEPRLPPPSVPPPGYSSPQQWPQAAFPPPPPYYANAYGRPQYPPPYPPPYPPQYASQAPANGLAIGSLVSSLVAIPGYLLCFGFIGSVVGVILGIVALTQIGKSGQRGRGMAIAGIVVGALGLVGMGVFSVLISSPSLWY